MMKRVIEAGAAEIQREEEEEEEQQCTQRDEEQIFITAVWSDRQQVHGRREKRGVILHIKLFFCLLLIVLVSN